MITENITVGGGTEYPVPGILTLPSSGTPCPAVVFVHGSGSSDKDEHVGKLYPFRDIAEGLAEQGIASIRHDKRSFVHGRKMVKQGNITVREEMIEDAVLAAEILRHDSRIDPERIFILGHSMGAMLAPRIDAEGGNFRGLILMSGSPRKLEEILFRQLKTLGAQSGRLMRWILGRQVKKFEKQFAGLYEMSDEEAKTKKFGGGTTLYYWKEMGEHPASQYLLANDKPLLILQGEKDFQSTVEDDYKAYQELLKDRPNVTWHLYEGLNHVMVKSVYGLISKANKEYKVPQKVSPEVIRDIAEWIHGF